jgi:CRP-like cAMP-binding protein
MSSKQSAGGLSSQSSSRYRKVEGDLYVFDNPAYTGEAAATSVSRTLGSQMRLKDFLASIPSFADFSDSQLINLERKASIAKFEENEIIFRQGEQGEMFFVIHSGFVDILIQDSPDLLRRGDLGKVVNRLSEGCYFGERALMTAEPRAATVRSLHQTVCITFSRETFEDVISGSNALIGGDVSDTVDWSKDHETRSLYKHIEKIRQIEKMELSKKIKRIIYELTTAFTPELSVDEVIARMVITVKGAVKGDRVGLFVLSEDRTNMVLKVSERSKGIRLPVRGLAGAVMTSSQPMNIPDAYQDNRFDSTLDRRTGYRTRQVLGVPLLHPISGETIGVLQVNNRSDGSLEKFSDEQQSILELAAEQLAELLYGRAELFMKTGVSKSAPAASILGSVPGYTPGVPVKRSLSTAVLSSADIDSPFEVELFSLSYFYSQSLKPGQFRYFKVDAYLFLALGQLCEPQSAVVELPTGSPSESAEVFDEAAGGVVSAAEMMLDVRSRLKFDISVRDLPRATRIMFKVLGGKKKTGTFVPLGWAAAAVFDFKGSMACEVNVSLFPDDNDVPINTTLSNNKDSRSISLSAVLAADYALSDDPESQLFEEETEQASSAKGTGKRDSMKALRRGLSVGALVSKLMIVHAMPPRSAPIVATQQTFTDFELSELNRVLMLSFNPMSMTLLQPNDKKFLWDLRYSILDRPELLPAFVMCVNWSNSEQAIRYRYIASCASINAVLPPFRRCKRFTNSWTCGSRRRAPKLCSSWTAGSWTQRFAPSPCTAWRTWTTRNWLCICCSCASS